MTKPLSLFTQYNSLGSSPSTDVFGITPIQKLIKDEVVFAAAKNPYEALNNAAKRLSAGESIFKADIDKTKQAA